MSFRVAILLILTQVFDTTSSNYIKSFYFVSMSYNTGQLGVKDVYLPSSRTYKKSVLEALQGKTAWQESIESD